MKRILIVSFRFITYLIMSLPFNFMRVSYLRIFMKIGKGSFIGRNVDIRFPFNIEIGEHTVINKNCVLDSRGALLHIGNNVDIAQETNIWTLEHNVDDENHGTISAPVFIDDYVWVASRCTILPGITISKGAVLACGAVVTKNVNSFEIVGGIPAKKIGIRNNNCSYVLEKPIL